MIRLLRSSHVCQTGVRTMKHANRENIDYVALHANRRARRGGSNTVPSSKPDRFGGYKTGIEPQHRRLRAPSKSWTASEYHSKGDTGCGHHRWVGVNHHKTDSEGVIREWFPFINSSLCSQRSASLSHAAISALFKCI